MKMKIALIYKDEEIRLLGVFDSWVKAYGTALMNVSEVFTDGNQFTAEFKRLDNLDDFKMIVKDTDYKGEYYFLTENNE